ncbi:acyl carrier protein-like protein [Hyaloraphidium curvatum]|nr:acyl carrier protein-like protein [Hyaloraphidium curvatum]
MLRALLRRPTALSLTRAVARPAPIAPARGALLARTYAGGGGGLSKDEIQERIVGVLKGFDKVDPSKISPEANFMTDLGLDSLDTVEVTMAIEEEFNVELPDEEAESIFTVKQAVEKIASNPNAI